MLSENDKNIPKNVLLDGSFIALSNRNSNISSSDAILKFKLSHNSFFAVSNSNYRIVLSTMSKNFELSGN